MKLLECIIILSSLLRSAPTGHLPQSALNLKPKTAAAGLINPKLKLRGVKVWSSFENAKNRYRFMWQPTDTASVADLDKKFMEFADLLQKNDESSWEMALDKADALEISIPKNAFLNYAFMNGNWYVIRRMLEKGYDSSELLKSLNSLPLDNAFEIIRNIGDLGIYHDKDGFQYTPSPPVSLYDKYNMYGFGFTEEQVITCVDNKTLLQNKSISWLISEIKGGWFSIYNPALSASVKMLNSEEKGLLLLYAVAYKAYIFAKYLIRNGADIRMMVNLLDRAPDMHAIYVYNELGSYELLKYYKRE